MKKFMTIVVVIILTAAFLAAGSSRAEAMDRESAVALTAGMVLLGIPVMHAIAHEAAHHDQAYGHAYPPRIVERTKIVYVEPRHKKIHRHRHHYRDWDRRWDRDRDRRSRGDSDRDEHRNRRGR